MESCVWLKMTQENWTTNKVKNSSSDAYILFGCTTSELGYFWIRFQVIIFSQVLMSLLHGNRSNTTPVISLLSFFLLIKVFCSFSCRVKELDDYVDFLEKKHNGSQANSMLPLYFVLLGRKSKHLKHALRSMQIEGFIIHLVMSETNNSYCSVQCNWD